MQIRSTKLTLVLLVVQIVFIVLFGVMVEYDDEAHARPDKESILEDDKAGYRDDQGNSIQSMYPSKFSSPTNMKSGTHVGLMLVQRRRRWTNIKPASVLLLI